jgi:hypothetical protein
MLAKAWDSANDLLYQVRISLHFQSSPITLTSVSNGLISIEHICHI